MTVCPAAENVVGLAVFANVSAGRCVAVTVADAVRVSVVPFGSTAVRVAVFATDPFVMSAWVVARVAVQVMVAFGASDEPCAGEGVCRFTPEDMQEILGKWMWN